MVNSVVINIIPTVLTLMFEGVHGTHKLIGDIHLSDVHMNLNCYDVPLQDLSLNPFNVTTYVATVTFVDCPSSTIPYANLLQALNVEMSTLQKLTLYFEHRSNQTPFNDVQFQNLSIQKLTLVYVPRTPMIQINSTVFLESLVNLNKFYVEGFALPPLPETSKLKIIWLSHGKSFDALGGCDCTEELRLYDWKLDRISDRSLGRCSDLKELGLWQTTNVSLTFLKKLLEDLPSLEILEIRFTDLNILPPNLTIYTENLQELRIADNNLRGKFSLRDINMESLHTLIIDEKGVDELEGLPQIQMMPFVLNLYDSPIRKWHFLKSDFMDLKQYPDLRVELISNNLKLDCDCQHGWLARAFVDGLITKSRTEYVSQCTDGTALTTVSSEVVECDRFDCDGCTCRRQWSDNTTVARCAGAATRVPRVWGLRALHAAGNRIETVSADDLPDSLLYLDMSRNHISSIDVNASAEMFRNRNRRVRLAGNPLVCNCGNGFLIKTLQIKKKQVDDYYKLWCIDEDQRRFLNDVIPSKLCAAEQQLQKNVQLSISVGALAALLGLAASAVVLYWRYRQHIKVYLYARGYCLWWLREEEVDSDRLYDAFLSFSHHDEKLVLEEIIPRLDREYKLCLHFRNWVVGDFIPAQISRSVQQSRRTIIVLSKNFVESVWGMLEFRTAHDNALCDGRARIIIVVLDDVVDDKGLASELRGYVRTNTYVRWGDRWFWDKIHYAMPHRRSLLSEPVITQQSATDDL